MPKRKGPNSELMVRAAAEGGQLAARGQEAVLNERQQAAAASQEGFQRAGSQLVEVGENEKNRDLQREKFAEDKRQYDRQEAIALADKGLEEKTAPQDEGQPAPPGGAQDPRQQALAQKMEEEKKKNAIKQGEKNLELQSKGTTPRFGFDAQRQAKEETDQQIRLRNAETAAMNARNAAERRNDSYKEAQYKQDQVALKELRTQIQAPMKADQKLRDDIGSDDITKMGPGDSRWKQLEEMIDDPLTGQHPSAELVDEVRSHTKGPNIARFISNRQAAAGIKMALDTGDLPDSDLIDTTNPMWQQFFAQTKQAEAFLGGSAIGQFVDVKSMQHKNRLVNQAAAMVMSLQPILGPMAQPAMMGASMLPGPARMAAQQGLSQMAAQGIQHLGEQPGGAAQQQQPGPAGQQQPAGPKQFSGAELPAFTRYKREPGE